VSELLKPIIEGVFGLLKQWWFWVILVVGGGLLFNFVDATTISSLADKAVEIIKALKGGG